MRDPEYLETVNGLIDSLVGQVRGAVDQDITLDEIRGHLDVETFPSEITDDDPRLKRVFEVFFLKPAVEQTHAEMTQSGR